MKLCVLVKEPHDIALAELATVARTQAISFNNIALVKTSRDLSRLAYTKEIHKVLFSCPPEDLLFKTTKYNWQRIYKKDFAVNTKGDLPFTKRELGGIIHDKLKKPKTNLKSPNTQITFFRVNDKAYACLLEHRNEEPFNKRKPQHWKAPHPSGMHPRLARAFINLTGIQSGKILDPFCGAGGLLMEASRLKLKPTGYDINDEMLQRAKTNLKHYKLKASLEHRDACSMPATNYVVADLPYGKNTKARDLEELYSDFFQVLSNKLRNTAVIGLPSAIDGEHLAQKAGLRIQYKFSIYLHKSLSKTILVLPA